LPVDRVDEGNIRNGVGCWSGGHDTRPDCLGIGDDSVLLCHGQQIPGGGNGDDRRHALAAQHAWHAAILIHHQRGPAGMRQIVRKPGRDADFAGIARAFQVLLQGDAIENADVGFRNLNRLLLPGDWPASTHAAISCA
jgi:hypothetical protein